MKFKQNNWSVPILLLILISLFISVPATLAANNNFLKYANNFYLQSCSDKKITNLNGAICFLIDKSEEDEIADTTRDIEITLLKETAASQSATISDLNERIETLENLILNPPKKQSSFTPDVPVDVTGYSKIAVTITGDQGSAALAYSDDKINWTLQSKFSEYFGAKSSYIFPVKARYYVVWNWGSPTRTFNYELDNTTVTAPTANFTVSPANPVVNEPITFTDTSLNAAHRIWEFSTPYSSYRSNQTETLTPTTPGPFTVHLAIQNPEGIEDIKTEYITVSN